MQKLLARIYAKYQHIDDLTINNACRRDFVFHMTDWIGDLDRLEDLYKHPRQFDGDTGGAIVAAFLWHALLHIRAAARLLLDWEPEDVFKEIDGAARADSKAQS